jgi:RHS repeat-associated protein
LYAWDGWSISAEYNGVGTGMAWTKSYVYRNGRVLATDSPNGIQYHHPDRLGTRLVTNTSGGIISENIGLPFGNTIYGESSNLAGNESKRRFTSYDRSYITRLDYAVNRHYSAAQGRFTQVDPIGVNTAHLISPQSLNLYAYCFNDPINFVDPSGLFLPAETTGAAIGGPVVAIIVMAVFAALRLIFGGRGPRTRMGARLEQRLAPVETGSKWNWPSLSIQSGVGALRLIAQKKTKTAQKKKAPCWLRILNAAWDIFKADQAKAGLNWEDRYKEIKANGGHPPSRSNDGLYPGYDKSKGNLVYVHGQGYDSTVYCNIYVHDVLDKAGVNHPHRKDNNHPLSANDWRKAEKIGGFEKITDGSMQRGDIVTSGSHMGIQTDTVATTGIDEVMASSSSANGEVKPYGSAGIINHPHVRWRCKD